MSSRTRRAALSVLIATMGLGALTGPAAGGVTATRFVDDDGTAGANGCDGAQSVPTSIQAAVDLSGPGDTIKVCPGTYPETVDVDVLGLRIEGVKRWKAKVNPTSTDIGAIIRIDADDVRVVWLKVQGRTSGSCQLIGAGILVDGQHDVSVIANHVLAAKSGDARFGPCGIQTGIHLATGSSALVRYNIVRDWRLQGIWLQSNDPGSAVKNNSVRFWHPDPCVTAACASRVGPAIGSAPIGIHIHNSGAVVSENVISSGEGSISPSYLTYIGIRLNSSTGVKVRANRIGRTASMGMEVNNTSDSRIRDNNLQVGVNGLAVSGASSGNTIRGNLVQSFSQNGIWLHSGATPNTLIDNVATQNGLDCNDVEGGNTWTDNTGQTDSPDGICTPV
jgi:parallel beta-helix repeat protein